MEKKEKYLKKKAAIIFNYTSGKNYTMGKDYEIYFNKWLQILSLLCYFI